MQMTSKEKGDLYEFYIRNLLLKADLNNRVWLWKDAPEGVLRYCTLLGNWNEYRLKRKENKINNLPDLGCDILLQNNDQYEFIQCKNYAETNSIRMDDLTGFFMMMTYQLLSQNSNFLGGKVYYTSKLSRHLLSQPIHDKLQYIYQNFEFEFELKEEIVVEQSNSTNNLINLMDHPFDYQLEAYEQLKNKHRTVLQLPCGMGKTLISMLVGKDYDNVVIISPLKEHCLQNLERFKNETVFLNYQPLLVDSDGTRNMDEIIAFISTNLNTILSVSYKSVDVLNKVIEQLTNCIVIFDEFHNISYNDVIDLKELDNEELTTETIEAGDEVETESEETVQIQTPINQLLYNQNVRIMFMSATPRLFEWDDDSLNSEIFGNIDYSYEMGEAIRKGYICDYEIYIPHLSMCHSDTIMNELQKEMSPLSCLAQLGLLPKIHFIVRGCLENGSKKCICYFNTQEDAKQFKEMLLQCNEEYYYLDLFVETILSEDTPKIRKNKLKDFKEWQGLAFLCSVRILDECIDIPSCDSIFMTTTCDSKIKNIQRMSRANRKDNNNLHKMSRIYIWTEEHNDIINMISHLKEYDNNFTHQKVKIINTEKDANKSIVLIRKNEEDKDEYQELDNMVIGIKKIPTWDENLEKLKQYVAEHDKLPSHHDKNKEIKTLGKWLSHQKQNHKNKTNVMKNVAVYSKWSDFVADNIKLFQSNEETWFEHLEEVKRYITETNCLPSSRSKNKDIKSLANWISDQRKRYKTQSYIMKNVNIVNEWSDFVNEYAELFKTNEEIWVENLEKAKQYVLEYNNLPSSHDNNKDMKTLGRWIQCQKRNYQNQTNIMKLVEIYNKWSEFVDEHPDLFKTDEETWNDTLEKVKQYIFENGKTPSSSDTNKAIKSLGYWVCDQKQNYTNQTNLMRNDNIYTKWLEFVNEYAEFFKSNEEIWHDNLEKVKQYIVEFGKLPSKRDKNKEIKTLGSWISTQKQNYTNKTNIMRNEEIYNQWIEFVHQYFNLFMK